MSDSFSDLPKFPKDEAIDMERLHDHLTHRPEPKTTFGDWLRYTWPSLILVAFALFAVFGLCVLESQVGVIIIGVPIPIILVVTAYIIWRAFHKPKP